MPLATFENDTLSVAAGACTPTVPDTISVSQHPSNLDPSARLISGPREAISIYRVPEGFVACTGDGRAIKGHFNTEKEARRSLAEVMQAALARVEDEIAAAPDSQILGALVERRAAIKQQTNQTGPR